MLIVAYPLLFFILASQGLKRIKTEYNNKTGWLLLDVGGPRAEDGPPNPHKRQDCASHKTTIHLAFQVLDTPPQRPTTAGQK
jgi:hypothetical protein